MAIKSKMAGEAVVRDVSGVYSRLFDHRAVLQNECKFVAREFESKRGLTAEYPATPKHI